MIEIHKEVSQECGACSTNIHLPGITINQIPTATKKLENGKLKAYADDITADTSNGKEAEQLIH